MIHPDNLAHELDNVVESASATAVQLSAIGIEMRAVLASERHDPGLTATVLSAHAKRAALALSSLTALVGKIDLLARLVLGLLLLAFSAGSMIGCSATIATDDQCEAYEACAADKTATVVCDTGSCSCVTSLPGENRVVSCATPKPPPESCELIYTSESSQVFKFADPDTVSPGGTRCTSLGGGVFECKPDVCLMLPYTGSCPHCPGGGE